MIAKLLYYTMCYEITLTIAGKVRIVLTSSCNDFVSDDNLMSLYIRKVRDDIKIVI